MKLDDLRKHLRKDRRYRARVRARKHVPVTLLRPCHKCGGPRKRLPLTHRDVVGILEQHPKEKKPTAAYRCRTCRIVWLVGPIEPEAEQ